MRTKTWEKERKTSASHMLLLQIKNLSIQLYGSLPGTPAGLRKL
jgi:hypothetical protein